MKFVFALLLLLTAVLYAQSSSSLFTGIGEYLAELIGDDVKSNEFCKANTTGLNLLILDGYFVVDRHVGGRIASIEVDASSTRIFTSDISREVPVWARVYGVSQAPSDSVIAILKEIRAKNADKVDRDEINVSFPYQDESIYKYKKFFG